ncbi:SDR family oxidoreductase [Streptosporangium sp. 'caverna']|uniref:SDR family oxidoreductase n=1 Tax=Streptosporangium sp. 'caverna' TaxID=2202249 RepID=UPI0013A6CA10|nr:NAD(P)H-binding protein [Streptosporangium sp. 'caverna']
MILITGATGAVGGGVLAELSDAGVSVRALTRRPEHPFPAGVEVVVGDLHDAATVERALDGVRGLFLFPEAPTVVAEALRRSPVGRVVTLSSSTVLDRPVDDVIARRHREAEAVAEASGATWVHLRPGAFASNALRWAPAIRAGDVVNGVYGDAVNTPIDPADIASVAARALIDERLENIALTLSGPQALSAHEQLGILSEVLGRSLQWRELDLSQARAGLAAHADAAMVESMLGLQAQAVRTVPTLSPTVREIIGHDPRTFADWARAHAEKFR